MNSKLNFGSTTEIADEFQFLMTTYQTIFEEEFDFYYRITDDGYIQLAYSYDNDELQIKAQYKLKSTDLKDNIKFIVLQSIEAHYLYHGLPKLKDSPVFTHEEFNAMIDSMVSEKERNRKLALEKETELITFLRDNKLNPQPSGNNANSWIAKCPSGGNHFILVGTSTDDWGCGYCGKKGKIPELKQWLQEIGIQNEQKNLSKMMKELKSGSIQTKETLKWWMNRY